MSVSELGPDDTDSDDHLVMKVTIQLALEESDAVTESNYQSNAIYEREQGQSQKKMHHLKILLGLEKFLSGKVTFVNSFLYVSVIAISYFSIHSFL